MAPLHRLRQSPSPAVAGEKKKPRPAVAGRGSCWEETRLLNHFAVEVDVETFDLDLLGDADADHRVEDLEDDPGADGAIHEGSGDVVELDQHLVGVAVDQPAAVRRPRWL